MSDDRFAEEYPFRPNFAEIEGHRMHYVDEGVGPVLILLHGNPTWSFLYRRWIKELRKNFRVIAPDHVGCGLSDKPEGYPYTLARRVSDLTALLEKLELRQNLTLLLHDWGGYIGMGYAATHPGAIRKLVLFNTGGFLPPPGKTMPAALHLARAPLIGALLNQGANAFGRIASEFYYKPEGAANVGELRAMLRRPYDSWAHRRAIQEFVDDIPVKSGDRSYATLAMIDENLHRLRDKPVLLCWGTGDFIFDGFFLKEWRERFPRAEVNLIEGAGHYALENAWSRAYPAVREFLDA